MESTRLSAYGTASMRPSPASQMMAAFAQEFRDGVDINLGVGYVNEATIPVALFEDALRAVASDRVRYRQAFNYGGPAGSANLVDSYRRFLTRHGAALEGRALAVGACGAMSILDALAGVLAPGIVVTSDPTYYIYADALERCGFRILAIPEDGEGPSLEVLERRLAELGGEAERISFFYVMTVNNPAGTVLSNARRRALYEVAARLSREQGRRIPIVYDLAYELLLHGDGVEPMRTVMGDDELGIVYEVSTLSKVLAPALRIGCLAGPAGALMDAVVQKTSDAGFSAPLFVQEMASWMLDGPIEEQLRLVNAGYREKARVVGAAIEAELGPYLESATGGAAGFYFYLTFKTAETRPGSKFFEQLTQPCEAARARVFYIPGCYCVERDGDLQAAGSRQLRLSYGYEEAPRIVAALRRMRQVLDGRGG